MFTIEKLNNDDLYLIRAFTKSLMTTFYSFLIFAVPLSFLFGLFGLTKKGIGYWNAALFFFAALIMLFVLNFLKEVINHIRDIKSKIKLVGIIIVAGKVNRNGDFVIQTDAKEIKEFNLFDKECFDQIEIGDKLTIQISKYRKSLLSLEKDGVDLLDCS
jgi:hypothetical protein